MAFLHHDARTLYFFLPHANTHSSQFQLPLPTLSILHSLGTLDIQTSCITLILDLFSLFRRLRYGWLRFFQTGRQHNPNLLAESIWMAYVKITRKFSI